MVRLRWWWDSSKINISLMMDDMVSGHLTIIFSNLKITTVWSFQENTLIKIFFKSTITGKNNVVEEVNVTKPKSSCSSIFNLQISQSYMEKQYWWFWINFCFNLASSICLYSVTKYLLITGNCHPKSPTTRSEHLTSDITTPSLTTGPKYATKLNSNIIYTALLVYSPSFFT